MTTRAGIGNVIAALASAPRVLAMAMPFAAVVLSLAACPGDGHGAQRSEAALSDHSIVHDSVIEPIQSGDERYPRAPSAGWGHGLRLAALNIDSGKLGGNASRAVNRWPAAQKADPAWEWVRVLVFLVQSALIVQGHDPGKPDGLMGPKTMLALLAWSAESGPSWNGNDDRSKSYRWGLDGNVAHLLHGTLEILGLSPGPKNRFLGRESVTALGRWDGTFRRAGMFMRFSEDVGRDIVMNELGPAGPSDSGEVAGPSTDVDEIGVAENTDVWSTKTESVRTERRSGKRAIDCIETEWSTDAFDKKDRYLRYKNTCDESVLILTCSEGDAAIDGGCNTQVGIPFYANFTVVWPWRTECQYCEGHWDIEHWVTGTGKQLLNACFWSDIQRVLQPLTSGVVSSNFEFYTHIEAFVSADGRVNCTPDIHFPNE